MRFRKLRIAWSVGWGIIAVLLIVLWARSYSAFDRMTMMFGQTHYFLAESSPGHVMLLTDSGGTWFDLEGNMTTGGSYAVEGGMANGWPQISDYNFAILRGSPSGVFLIAPYWAVLLLLSVFGVIPVIGMLNRFSLRTLFIFTTLVAVVLGLIVWLSH